MASWQGAGEQVPIPLNFSRQKFFLSKNAKLGARWLSFWENLGAVLKFWMPISFLADICNFWCPIPFNLRRRLYTVMSWIIMKSVFLYAVNIRWLETVVSMCELARGLWMISLSAELFLLFCRGWLMFSAGRYFQPFSWLKLQTTLRQPVCVMLSDHTRGT